MSKITMGLYTSNMELKLHSFKTLTNITRTTTVS